MAENLIFPHDGDRKAIYEAILPQIKAITTGEKNITANLANIAAILKEALGFFWVGFYVAETENELVLAPFQGSLACTRIRKGKGVCGAVFKDKTTLIVADVDAFPGHIACSSLSKSEIVLPIFNSKGEIYGVLDVDSDILNDFTEIDKIYLEELTHHITTII